MAIHGFVTHAAANRRKLWWLVASYILAFEVICAFALIVLLALYDPANTIITNPVGYAIRYVLPVALFAYLLFRIFYTGHLKHVQKKLAVKIVRPDCVTEADEKRFLRLAEQICITSGLRLPQFGIIEATEPNALAVGATRDRGLIAVTRGMLQQFDDEELAAVVAHEAAHIRNGDTQIMAANYALMRTAINLQVNNPLRLESWQPLLLAIALPFFLPLLLAGNAATMLAMRLSFQARRGISDSRDFIADGEVVRVTQFPDALISALRKASGQNAFTGSEHFRPMLFCGGDAPQKDKQPSVGERIKSIESLSGAMLDANRIRRDTRDHAAPLTTAAAPKFGAALRKPTITAPPPMPSLLEILARPRAWVEWHEHCVDYGQWREEDERNAFGLTPRVFLPLAFTLMFLAVFHWPTHGTLIGAIQIFNPANLVMGYETEFGGINVFKYASEEATLKQNWLTFVIMAFFIIASVTPGLREYVYPHVDWEKQKRKSSGILWRSIMNGKEHRPIPAPENAQVEEGRCGTGYQPTAAKPDISDSLMRVARRAEIAGIPIGGVFGSRGVAPSTDNTSALSSEPEPSFGRRVLDEVSDFAKGEAVERLSGGWITLGDDDDDDNNSRRPQEKRESFNERLERELAKLSNQPADLSPSNVEPQSFHQRLESELAKIAPQETVPPVSQPAPSVRPSPFAARPQGFGRKIA